MTPEQAQALAIELSRAADAGLFHPSIVEPVAAGVEATVAYRAEEYVAGESLDAAIRHYAPASLDKALPFITQLAGAIDFARAAGVGHGALHLRDVFVTPEEARASGFGVVEALERVGLRAPVRRPYSAPERIAGETWGTPADVFSLAAIAFELLAGRRPAGTGDRIGSLAGENLGPHADMIHGVLARAMDDDPSLRHPSALGFASALEAAARGERVTGAMEQVGAISGMAAPAPGVPRAVHAPVDDAAGRTQDARSVEFVEPAEEQVLEELESGNEPGVEEAAATLLLDPAADESFDDIAIERELDDSHALLTLDQDSDGTVDARERTLFDDDEAAADVGLDTPPTDRFAAAVVPGASRGDDSFEDRYGEDRDMRAGTAAEPARPAMLPLALMLILGLLVGFAAGYAIGERGDAGMSRAEGEIAADAEPEPQPGTPASEDTAGAASGRTFSEGVITPPPVIPDAPPPDAESVGSPAAASGRLVVRSTPSNAGVTVNGDWAGRTPLTLDELALGSYAVRVVADGFEVAQRNVRLTAADPSNTVNVRLARNAAAPPPRRAAPPPQRAPAQPTTFTGSIYVDSRPRGARVVVDGKPVGTTPLRLPEIPIGSHVVRLELADHRAWTSATRVAAGQEARVTGSLERIR